MAEPHRSRHWLLLLISNGVLLYSHYTSLYVLFIQGLSGLLFIPRAQWKFLIGTLTLSAIIYVPYATVFIERLGHVSGNGSWVPEPGWGEIYGNVNLLLNNRYMTVVAVFAIALGSVIAGKEKVKNTLSEALSDRSGLTIVLWFAVPYLLMFFVSKFFLPMFMDRYVTYLTIPLIISLVWLTDLCWRDTPFAFLGALLLISGSLLTSDINPDNNRRIKATVERIKAMQDAETEVLICPDMFHLAFAYHYDRDIFKLTGGSYMTDRLDSALGSRYIWTIRRSDEVNTEAKKVIYLDAASEFVYPDNGILEKLKNERPLLDTAHYHEIFDIYLFGPRQSIQSPSVEEDVTDVE